MGLRQFLVGLRPRADVPPEDVLAISDDWLRSMLPVHARSLGLKITRAGRRLRLERGGHVVAEGDPHFIADVLGVVAVRG